MKNKVKGMYDRGPNVSYGCGYDDGYDDGYTDGLNRCESILVNLETLSVEAFGKAQEEFAELFKAGVD